MKKKINWLGVIGRLATIEGFAIEMVQSYVADKESEKLIDEKIKKAFEERGQ